MNLIKSYFKEECGEWLSEVVCEKMGDWKEDGVMRNEKGESVEEICKRECKKEYGEDYEWGEGVVNDNVEVMGDSVVFVNIDSGKIEEIWSLIEDGGILCCWC